MKKVTSKLTIEQQQELESLAALSDEQINTDDMPEVTDWSDAKRGLFYYPPQEEIILSLDIDVIEWFKQQHPHDDGYPANINKALREYVNQHRTVTSSKQWFSNQ
jgi:uncharacterized protein (DUF4415 family)